MSGISHEVTPTRRSITWHFSAIAAEGYKSLDENQRVEFETAQGPKGLQAENVRVI